MLEELLDRVFMCRCKRLTNTYMTFSIHRDEKGDAFLMVKGEKQNIYEIRDGGNYIVIYLEHPNEEHGYIVRCYTIFKYGSNYFIYIHYITGISPDNTHYELVPVNDV